MKNTKKIKGKWINLVVFVIFLAMAPIAVQAEATTLRPIEDFVSQQGTFCIEDGTGGCYLFVPPAPNYVAWSDSSSAPPTRQAWVDYAGLANEYIKTEGGTDLGTKIDGSIKERKLSNGREVTVQLHTTNALTFVTKVLEEQGINNWPLLFGFRAAEVEDGKPSVLDGATPALGDSYLKVVFTDTKPVGAPMPDLVQLVYLAEDGQKLKYISFNAKANGELRAAFGVPVGTSGRATIIQTGLLDPGTKGSQVQDGYPVERIDLKVVGK